MEVKDAVALILKDSYLLSLATLDEEGVWSTILAFVHDEDFNIYWMSEPNSRHSKAIKINPKAAVSLSSTSKPEDNNMGLQIVGSVQELSGDLPELHSLYFNKKNELLHAPRHEVQGFVEKWYKLIPERIDVTYEPEWSFIKKTYIPNQNI